MRLIACTSPPPPRDHGDKLAEGRQLVFVIMLGTLIGSRRTSIVLGLGLALTSCTSSDEPARQIPTMASSSSDAAQPDLPARPPTASPSEVDAISCLDGEWSFGSVQRQRIVSHVTEPLLITSRDPVRPPPLRPLRRVVAEVQGNAPPELTYAQVRRLLPPELNPPPLGTRIQAGETGISDLITEPGLVVFYELADVISVDYRYTCQGRPDFGSVTTWTEMGGGILRCDAALPPDPPDIADVRAIACPAA